MLRFSDLAVGECFAVSGTNTLYQKVAPQACMSLGAKHRYDGTVDFAVFRLTLRQHVNLIREGILTNDISIID